ncbi:MAG: hypothetical protein U0X93_05800 [Anaerolineales bacterium]
MTFSPCDPEHHPRLDRATDFNSVPYLRPLIENLNSLQDMNGTGIFVG